MHTSKGIIHEYVGLLTVVVQMCPPHCKDSAHWEVTLGRDIGMAGEHMDMLSVCRWRLAG